jgi:RNA-directed DNA polymerase
MQKAKSFEISKHLVWQAYLKVKELEDYEKDVKNNLYKLWNRMSSGTYFPKPVRLVEIPKDSGGTRTLGIATIEDRVAQQVVVMMLEPLMEPHFHNDSYGYRPGRS